MKDMPLHRKFFYYALPSVLSQLLNSCFIIVDGFFIGQNLGDVGLAAINVAWPITSLIQSASLAIGVGGSVRMAMALGQNDMQQARKARGNALFTLVIAAVILSVGLYFLSPYILPLIGANEDLYPLSLEYIEVVCLLAAGQIINTGVLPLLRGSHQTVKAMMYTVVGLISNIVLDWLFIQEFHWGLGGAAFATALSHILCALISVPTLLFQKKMSATLREFIPDFGVIKGIIHFGIAPFGLSLSTSVIMLVANVRALAYGGTQGVAIYAVLSYVLGAVIPLATGVGDGIQPLLSYAKGAGNWHELAKLRKWGLMMVLSVALGCSLITWVGRYQLPLLFGASAEAAVKGAGAMWTLCLAYPFMGVVRFCSSYFCAVGQPLASGILAYGEPLVAQPVALFALPLFMQLTGVWVAYPAAVIVMAGVALFLLYQQMEENPNPEALPE